MVVVMMSSVVHAQVYSSTNLRAHFTFDTQKTVGTQTFGQFGLNGSIRNGVLTNQTDCTLFTCYRFDGTNDDVQITNLTPFTVGNQLTISAWFNRSVSGAGSDRIVSSVGGIGQVIWEMSVTAAPERLECRMRDSLATNLVVTGTANSVTEGTIMFGTCVFNSTGISLYLNGRLNATGTATYLGNFNPADFVYIGDDDGTAANFEGMIDDVKFFNTSLNASQVLNEYNNGFGLLYNNPPPAPNLTSPANGTVVQGVIPFSWSTSVDPDGDPVSYQFLIDSVVRNTTTATTINFSSLSLTPGNHTWFVRVNDTYYTNTSVTRFFTVDNDVPNITITFPNHPLNWSNGTILGSCADTVPGSVFFNSSSSFTLNDSTYSSWRIVYEGASANNVSITIGCNDTFGHSVSTQRTYNFDVVFPNCYENGNPIEIEDHSVTDGTNYQWNVQCFDDSNYFYLNVTCTGGTNFDFFDDNINQTMYNFTELTGTLHSDMTCVFESADAHTDDDITDLLNPSTVYWNDGELHVPDNDGLIRIRSSTELSSSQRSSIRDEVADAILDQPIFNEKEEPGNDIAFLAKESISSDMTYATDRVQPVLTTDTPSDINVFTFEVTALDRLQYVRNNQHHAWFVVDNTYWIDFDLLNDDGSTTWDVRINGKKTATVVITTRLSTLEFASVGIININQQTQSFFVTNPPALEADATLFINVCPTNLNQVLMVFATSLISFVLIAMGWYVHSRMIGALGCLSLIAIGATLVGCQQLYGVLLISCALIGFTLFFKRSDQEGRLRMM